jgi:putative transposase
MARTARIVVPGLPHHVTQRGNRRQPIFLRSGDETQYLHMLTERCSLAAVEVWAYCLMPNHVHLVMTPQSEDGLAKAVGEAHRQYTSLINARERWRGHLFQDRFASSVMDERHLIAAFRYVALNPVRAGLAERAQDWPWSSVHAHLFRRDGRLVKVQPLLSRVDDVEALFAPDPKIDSRWAKEVAAIRSGAKRNEPVGAREFVEGLRKTSGAARATEVGADRGQVARLRAQPVP